MTTKFERTNKRYQVFSIGNKGTNYNPYMILDNVAKLTNAIDFATSFRTNKNELTYVLEISCIQVPYE